MNSNIWKNYIYTYICENNLLDFYTRFLEIFENEWGNFISNYNFEKLCQLNNGNRLRPMLVFWGYLLNKDNDDLFNISDQEMKFVMAPCVTVESIHKMSLLVDDWIDDDIARHGDTTFHVIYGADTAILLAMNIMLSGFIKLNCMHQKVLPLALQITYDMTQGALNEVSRKQSEFDISAVKEIINLETSSIIRNGLIIGFTVGGGTNREIIDLLDDIGYCCGYIFQSLNDLEPFGNDKELIRHKGALTTDILKNRKNIVIAYIHAWADEKELKHISSIKTPELLSEYVISLINKYCIKEHMLTEISNLQLRIRDRITQIKEKTGHSNWCKHFEKFIDITISASKTRSSC